MENTEGWMEGLMSGYWSSASDEEVDQEEGGRQSSKKTKSAKRIERFERTKMWKKMKDKEKRQQNRSEASPESRIETDKPTKREMKNTITARLERVQNSRTTPKICIDMGLTGFMNDKEISRLAGQIRRVYGSNRRSAKPLHLTLSNLDPNSSVYEACERQNDGFRNYQIHMTDRNHLDLFPKSKITYLTPDSETVLTCLEADTVYVLGGLVDESPNKNYTLQLAGQQGLATARLPISEYFQHAETGSFNQILSINQIFDILLRFYLEGDWTSAILAGIPRRKGFVPK